MVGGARGNRAARVARGMNSGVPEYPCVVPIVERRVFTVNSRGLSELKEAEGAYSW